AATGSRDIESAVVVEVGQKQSIKALGGFVEIGPGTKLLITPTGRVRWASSDVRCRNPFERSTRVQRHQIEHAIGIDVSHGESNHVPDVGRKRDRAELTGLTILEQMKQPRALP